VSRLSILAPVGAALFTISWLVLGAVSPGYELFGHVIAPYSPIAQPISGLGFGVTGPWMNAAFVVSGLLVLAGTLSTAAAWWRLGRAARVAFVLLSLTGVGMVVCGVFTLESMMLHLSGFLLAVPLPAIGCLVAAAALRGRRGLSATALVGGILILVLFVVFQLTFDATGAGGNTGVAGLVQRVLVLVALATVCTLTVGVARLAARPAPVRAAT
jgi:hypothetical protein